MEVPDPERLRDPIDAYIEAIRGAPWIPLEKNFLSVDGILIEIRQHWGKIKYPAWLFEVAESLAVRRPIIFRRSWANSVPQLVKLASLAFHLQRFVGDLPIILPVEVLAEFLGCDRRRSAAFLSELCGLGVLVVTDPTWSVSEKRAREFRFVLESDQYTAPSEGSPSS